MAWFRNMKIGRKLISAFLLMAIITAIVSGAGILLISNITQKDTYMYEYMTRPIAVLSSIYELFQEVRVSARDLVLSKSVADMEKYTQNITEDRQEFSDKAAELEKMVKTDTKEMQELFHQFTSVQGAYTSNLDNLIELVTANQETQALALLRNNMLKNAEEEIRAIEAMVNYKLQSADDTAASNAATATMAKVVMVGIMAISTVIAVAMGIVLSRMLSKPMAKMVEVANKIANKDMDVEITYSGDDEIGQLAQAFDRMIDNLNRFVSNVRSSAEQVASGSRQIADSSQALSQGATEQASSVEEVTASLEQVSVQTRRNAERAGEASEISLMAKKDALQGDECMKGMLKAMEEINEASSNISKIIKVIDSIAFQTNILALNAAVEAARAGQHGKGFAVVAEEVRTLAARSANAASETTALIEGSIKKAEGGTKVAGETAAFLRKIVEGVTKAADLVGQIAVASNEQSAGISQINKAVSQVSDVIQTNSATSEESAAASEELSGQADVLKDMIAQFRLKKQIGASYTDTPAEEQEIGQRDPGKEDVSINLGEPAYGKYSF